MDLSFAPATATATEVAAVAQARFTSGGRSDLLPGLWALQQGVGAVTLGGLNVLCERLGVPPAEAYGVATFYDLLNTSNPPQRTVRVCDDIVCRREGSNEVKAALAGALGPPNGSGERSWTTTSCLGRCEAAPAVLSETPNGLVGHGGVSAGDIGSLPSGAPAVSAEVRGEPGPLLARAADAVTTLEDYRAFGGLRGIDSATQIGADGCLEMIEGLVGRGGAAFPTATKWRGAMAGSEPRYVVANADESEPGTFKDRVLLERDPFGVLEGILIACHVIGAKKGWVYIRGEYPEAERALAGAIGSLGRAGVLGDTEIEIRRGAGAYICGEETALFNSIEGFRGEPRHKPPFPTQNGLFGRPTVINNVETLVNVTAVLSGDPEAGSTKLFSVTGVNSPGVVEVPLGTTLRSVIDQCDGVAGTGAARAVLVGGAAGAFVTDLDIPLDLPGGVPLGSGAILVFDDETDFSEVLGGIARFFAHESCGQCVPCRIGTAQQSTILQSPLTNDSLARLAELDAVMTDASICGLGQTASSAVRSALALGLIGAT